MIKHNNVVYVVYSKSNHKGARHFYLRGVFKDHDRAIREAKRMTKWDPFDEEEKEAYTIIKETDHFIEMSNDYYKDDEEYSERIFVLAEGIQP